MKETNPNGTQAVPRASLIDAMLERAASWLDARNHLISSVMEETVTNRQIEPKKVPVLLHFQKLSPSLQCSSFETGESVRQPLAVGLFCANPAIDIVPSRVVCLMAPLPVSGEEQRGAEHFLFPSRLGRNHHTVCIYQHIVSFKCSSK